MQSTLELSNTPYEKFKETSDEEGRKQAERNYAQSPEGNYRLKQEVKKDSNSWKHSPDFSKEL